MKTWTIRFWGCYNDVTIYGTEEDAINCARLHQRKYGAGEILEIS